jgi:hypothetical protein
MNRPRRTSTRMSLNLETLDERIAPAHIGLAALHAEIAEHRAAVLSRLEARHQARVLHAQQAAQHATASSQAHALLQTARVSRPALASVHSSVRQTLGVNAPAATTPPAPSAATVTTNATGRPVSTGPVAPVTPFSPPTAPTGTSTNLPSSLPANAGDVLNTIYQEYQTFKTSGGTGTFTSSSSPYVVIQGSDVRVDVHGNGSGDFGTLVAALQGLGMHITAADTVTQTVEGMVPIDQLPTVAQEPQTLSVSPSYRMILS